MKILEALSKWNRDIKDKFEANYEVGVLSNTTTNQLKYFLEIELFDKTIKSLVTIGAYDNIVNDSANFSNKNAVIIFFDLINLSNDFIYKINLLEIDKVDQIYENLCNQILLIFKNLEKVPIVFFNKFSIAGIGIQHNNRNYLNQLCTRLNKFLENNKNRNTILVSPDQVHMELGLCNSIDMRSFRNNKTWYTYSFMREYSRLISPMMVSAVGKTKKVLVVDCDNTLWGGVIGEEGIQGVKLGKETRRGQIFTYIQMLIKGLHKNGVLLAINSKNNFEDVSSMLRTHPSMILKEEDFIIIKANWQDKASNLREIALELNVGIDSLIFLDDSEFELGLVSRELPQVKSVRVPENLELYPLAIQNIYSDFYNPNLSDEDLNRNQMYRQEIDRKNSAQEFGDIEDYLRSLDLKLKILWGGDIDVVRASQMTQKTNQFNLTTKRYSESEIEAFTKSTEILICTISVGDKYGDSGVTGLAILNKISENLWSVDTFLMSCRIIGRGIEYKFLDLIIGKLNELNIFRLAGKYIKTAKNDQVKNFWSDSGFKLISEDGDVKIFEQIVRDYKTIGKDYIEVI